MSTSLKPKPDRSAPYDFELIARALAHGVRRFQYAPFVRRENVGHIQNSISSSPALQGSAGYTAFVRCQFKLTAVFQGALHLIEPVSLRCLHEKVIAGGIISFVSPEEMSPVT